MTKPLGSILTATFWAAVTDFRTVVASHDVAAAWTRNSVLEGYTVGGIAGHVTGLLERLRQVLEQQGTAPLEVVRYTEWYGRTAETRDGRSTLERRLIEAGEAAASPGPDALIASFDTTKDRLRERLADADGSLIVPLASIPGAGVWLQDFVRTRIVELVVHTDDLNVSIGRSPHSHAQEVWDITLGVLAQLAAVRYPPVEVVRAFARTDRASRTTFPVL